jgi:lysophospholipase L1-like esterase
MLALTAVGASAGTNQATTGVAGCGSPAPTSPVPASSAPVSSAPPVGPGSAEPSASRLVKTPPTKVPDRIAAVDVKVAPAPSDSVATASPSDPPSSDPEPTEWPTGDLCDDEPYFGDDGTCLASPRNCDEYFRDDNKDEDKRDDKIPDDKPVLVALGDSVTSGHHKEQKQPTACDDRDYSYANALYLKMRKDKAANWGDPDQYQNYAHSGFGTKEVIDGGENACKATFGGADIPLAKATKLLTAHANKGNFVVLTVGINDTNWVQLIEGIAGTAAWSAGKMAEEKCDDLLWNGSGKSFAGLDFYDEANSNLPEARKKAIAKLRQDVSDRLTGIIKKLVAADPTVHIVFLNYYNPSGSGFSTTAFIGTFKGPVLPESCRKPIQKRLDSANGLLKDAARGAFDKQADFDARVSFVTAADLNDPKNGLLQSLFAEEQNQKPKQPPGWPHPNQKGHGVIADQMYKVIGPKL